VAALALIVLEARIAAATLLVDKADAAYLNRSECLNALVGSIGDNEVGRAITQVNNSSIGPATGWNWTGHNRINSNLIQEGIVVYGRPFFQQTFTLTCRDRNGNGLIRDAEMTSALWPGEDYIGNY
jgi:hypothetical protein